jgi:hypothetical protein
MIKGEIVGIDYSVCYDPQYRNYICFNSQKEILINYSKQRDFPHNGTPSMCTQSHYHQ